MNQRTTLRSLGFFSLISFAALGTGTIQCANTVGDGKPGAIVDAPAAPGPAGPLRPSELEDVSPTAVRVPIDGLPVFGSSRALVTIVFFAEYECRYCVRAAETLTKLREEYGDDLRVAVASRPLPMHLHAPLAARAFLAAQAQGKGEAMNARLFANKTKSLDADGLRAAAKDIGLDLEAFDQGRASSSVDAALAKSETLAEQLQVVGTPTTFVNGRRIVGAQPIELFRRVVDEELEKAKAAVTSGVAPEAVYAHVLTTSAEYVPRDLAAEAVGDEVMKVDTQGAPVRGSASAPVVVVVYSDFECPYCQRLATKLAALEKANAGIVQILHRQNPLPIHPHAKLAAKASIAADRQGRFWEYHDVLFAHSDALERADLERYAADVGLDVARFDRDLDSPEVEAALAADLARAKEVGATGTPTSFVNGHRVRGAQPPEVWVKAVQRSLTELGMPSDKVRPH